MAIDRITIVEGHLDSYLAGARPAVVCLSPGDPLRPGSGLDARTAVQVFEDQLASRALDVAAHRLKREGRGFYTIGSAGHEQNAVVGSLLRPSDPCLLHYRSGAFMMARWRKARASTPVFDTLLSLCASAEDPISGGRHKVWGSRELWVPPQTSTIASHLPKATGLAFALSRARRIGLDTRLPEDAIVCCSFGDASANHAAALSGINAARYAMRRSTPAPILFVCEDNGRGISVETPSGWIHDLFSRRPYLAYFEAQGELDAVWDAASAAIQRCRSTRSPVFLHLHCVRLWGHAGSDMESAYRSLAEIEGVEAGDPLLRNARRLVETGAAAPEELQALVADTRERVAAAAVEAATRPKLETREEVMAPLAPYDEARCRRAASAPVPSGLRSGAFAGKLPEDARTPSRRTMAAHINAALTDAMLADPALIVFGEDVGKKGGVYGVTRHLQERFGRSRVFDTLLDETSILGVAQGAAHLGFTPVPEIQYLAYLHNAIDQLRGEAATLQFFSAGQFRNPMVVRIAGLAYQKGFGGHFHNDNSLGALREIPGLVLASPARGDDAARVLRGCLAMAREFGRVVCFVEPIALYHERDLYEPGDGLWLSDYPPPDGSAASALLPGDVGVFGAEHSDLLLVSYANGVAISLRAARRLEREHGIRCRIVDLRWLSPLPEEALAAHAAQCGALVVVDECRKTGAGVADALISGLAQAGFAKRARAVQAADSFVPLGAAANLVLVSEDDVVAAALEVAV